MPIDSSTSAAVSVILPTHNRPQLLREAIDSLLRQTFTNWEALIIDDASTPPAEHTDDPRIRLVRHEAGKGGAACKNTGIRLALAPVIAFLDDDDLYAPTYLERAMDLLDRHPELDLVFMGVSWFGSAGENGQRNYDEAMARALDQARGEQIEDGVIVFGEMLFDALLRSVPMGFQRPVVRRDALENIGGYRPDCLLWDCDWALSAALRARLALISDGLYLQRAEGQGYSSRGDRRLEQMASNIEIKQRLLRDTLNGHLPRHLAPKLRRAAARGWFDLAWHHYQRNERRKALYALLRSESIQFSLNNLKLLARIVRPGGTS